MALKIKIFDPAPEGTPVSEFIHLHVHSDYSIRDGASKLNTLIARAKQLNMPALALTDHGNMFGVLNFEHICRANGINPIIGEEFYVAYGKHTEQTPVPYGSGKKKYFHLILLCENVTGYKNMCWLSSLAYRDGFWSKPRIDFELLEKYHEGIICLSACIQGELPQLLLNDMDDEARELALKYKNLCGPDHYYIELQDHGLADQKYTNEKMIKLARELDIPMVVTNDVHYCYKEDAEAQDALCCIGFQQLLDDPNRRKMGDGRPEWYLKSESEMRMLFPDMPELISNTTKIANMCDVTIPQYKTQQLKDCLPRFKLPDQFCTHGDDYKLDQDDYVRYLVEEGLKKRYDVITQEIRDRTEYELGIIFQMGFSGYFLIVWEFINWAKSTWDNVNNCPKHYIPIGPGRGSGAGSIVAYAMTITDIDPIRYKLIFERFLNPERVSMPDFDVDMDFDYRQEIIQHTRDLYGNDNVGHIVTFATLKAKQVIKDVARVLDIPLPEVKVLTDCIPGDDPKFTLDMALTPPTKETPDNGKLIPYTDVQKYPQYERLFRIARKLENVIRGVSLHASGMVIGLTELPNWAPVYKDNETGKLAVQYTMDIIEPCGLVKFDYLGLKTLSLIRYTEEIINKHKAPDAPEFITSQVSETDEKTFDLFTRGDTVAIFQFESPGMQKILRNAKPQRIEELVALNALYRPGPMQFIDQYVKGKWDPSTVKYPDPCLEGILKETNGVMVYQEQVMQVAQRIAGYSLGGADLLRRAMGKKIKEEMAKQLITFEEGAVKQGFKKEHADEIFRIMEPFAGYGFNKSHAAAYSVLAYRTGWLKANYPAEYMAANLTNEITSTDKLPVYIEEARRLGIPVDAPDVNRSDAKFDVVDGHIVFGFEGIKGMGESAANAIVKEREENGPYKSFMDFLERVVMCKEEINGLKKQLVNKKAIEVLIKTGGFDCFGVNRPTLLENLQEAYQYATDKAEEALGGQKSLFDDFADELPPAFTLKPLPDISNLEKLEMEKQCIGIYVSGNPLDDYKKAWEMCSLKSKNLNSIALMEQAKRGQIKNWHERKNAGTMFTTVGFLSELKKITSKKTGKDMAFGKLLDYDGEIPIAFFDSWPRFAEQIEPGKVYALKGKVNLRDKEASLVVEDFESLEKLHQSHFHEVHIELYPVIKNEYQLTELREMLYDSTGNCKVFLHINLPEGNYVVEANSMLLVEPTKELCQRIKNLIYVKDCWFQ